MPTTTDSGTTSPGAIAPRTRKNAYTRMTPRARTQKASPIHLPTPFRMPPSSSLVPNVARLCAIKPATATRSTLRPMRTDAEVLAALLGALSSGDIDAIGPLLTDDAESVNPPYAMEAGTRHGREAVL